MIGASWEKYLRQVMPSGAGAVQIEETRRAFYAGGFAVFSAFLALDDDDEPAAMLKLDKLKAEFEAYRESFGGS
jgi:hypothetical protein